MAFDHEHNAEDFQIQANKSNSADVKAFAAKTWPVFQGHLKMIRNIKSRM